jgi:DNA helicase-2/ATP-dependent DNA helicase PcrA
MLHVLIDEAQDYSMLHLAILKMLYPKSSYTLLADVCQAISPVTTIGSYEEFQWVFGEELEQLPLLKSYRSSGSINALAFQMMSRFQKEYSETYSYFQREGKKPRYVCSRNIYQTIQELLKGLEHYNMVGILTKDESTARLVHEELSKYGEAVQLIDKPYDEMKERIIVLPLIYSKGLEFDAVIACGFMEGEIDDSFACKMYLACTRALHELYFVEEKELPVQWQECRDYLEMVKE